jgi:hypothetical protein
VEGFNKFFFYKKHQINEDFFEIENLYDFSLTGNKNFIFAVTLRQTPHFLKFLNEQLSPH